MTPLWRAYRSWRGLAGPLADHVLPSPFLAPWSPVPLLPRAAGAGAVVDLLARRTPTSAGSGEQTAVFLETTPRLGLAAGWRLRGAGWAVAPLYGRWPAPGAVLPTERLTSWLLAVAGAPPRSATAPVREAGAPGARPLCLLLDAERARRVPPAALRRRFDNRYDYPDYLFPPPRRLREWGVGRALWAGPSASFPPGLQDYAESLVRAGISLDLVRLPLLPSRGRLPPGPSDPCAP